MTEETKFVRCFFPAYLLKFLSVLDRFLSDFHRFLSRDRIPVANCRKTCIPDNNISECEFHKTKLKKIMKSNKMVTK